MSQGKIPEWLLERYLLGELPEDKMKEVEIQIKKDNELEKEIMKLKKSNKNILDKYPSDHIVSGIIGRYNKEMNMGKKSAKSRSTLVKRILIVTPALVSVVVVFFIVFLIYKSNNVPSQNGIRTKGSLNADLSKSHLILHRKKDNTVELLSGGSKARAGDLLQIAYVSGSEPYGMILSVDGNGMVTLHYPYEKGESTTIKQKKKTFLSSAYELDNAPDFERFFFVTSKSEIDVEKILKSARDLATDPLKARKNDLDLNTTFVQYSILILKGD